MALTIEEILPLHSLDQRVTPQILLGVHADTLQKVLEHSVLRSYPGGYLLLRQGDQPQCLYLIVRGSVKTLRTDNEGREAVIRLLKAGETCMEAVLFMDVPSSPITVQVIDEAQLLVIPDDLVRSLALEDAVFANNLLRIIARHYKNAMQQIDSVSTKMPLQRIGYYLLVKHLESQQDGTVFKLPFKKSTIAQHLGMTPETFSRAIKQLRDLGVDIDGDNVTLRDVNALCQFCDTDTAALCPSLATSDCISHTRKSA
jgi:CRP-like cAMP-binding protein